MIIHIFLHLNKISEQHLEFYGEILHWGFECSTPCIWNVRIARTRTAVKFKRWRIRQMAEQKWSALPWRKAWCHPQQSVLKLARVWLLWKHPSQPWVLQYASFPRNRLMYNMYYFLFSWGRRGELSLDLGLWFGFGFCLINAFIDTSEDFFEIDMILCILAYPSWKLLLLFSPQGKQKTTICTEYTDFYSLFYV